MPAVRANGAAAVNMPMRTRLVDSPENDDSAFSDNGSMLSSESSASNGGQKVNESSLN